MSSRRSVLARQALILGITGVAYLCLAIYATTSDTGVVGWLNAAQARSDGTYSRKITLLVLTFAGVIVAAPFWLWLYPRHVPPRDPGAAPLKGLPRFGVALLAFVVLDAVVWAGAFGWAAWDARGKNVDAAAVYTPLALAAAAPLHAAAGDHLAVRGRLLGEHVVTRTEGQYSKKMALVPIVEPGWNEGDPVHLLLSIESDQSLVVREALRSNDGVLLVRVEGAVPAPALEIFTRMKAPVADDARTLTLVPSEGGRPTAPPSELNWLDIQVGGGIGSACVLIVCFFYTIMPWMVRRAARQAADRAARQAGRR